MQEYKRQIAYLYAYERGEQLRSTGFVKAEERGGHCRLALHLRGYCHPGEAAGNVYIYFYHLLFFQIKFNFRKTNFFKDF